MSQNEQPTVLGSKMMSARALHTLSFIKPMSIICEIGVGRGVFAQTAKQKGYYYIGIDMDASLDHVNIVACIPPMPVIKTVDAIVAESILEHMPDYASCKQVIHECYDLLRTDGRMIIRVPDIRYAKERFWDSTEDHAYVTSTTRIAKIAHEAGFVVVEHGHYIDHYTGWKCHAIYWIKECWPWRTLHTLFYHPWQESVFSKIDEKVPSTYMVLEK